MKKLGKNARAKIERKSRWITGEVVREGGMKFLVIGELRRSCRRHIEV